MGEKEKSIVYAPSTVEFVTVAVQYCRFLESFEDEGKPFLTDKLTKLLPLLYLKASLLPESQFLEEDEEQEVAVTEDLYNHISSRLYAVYANDDSYLEVFLQDMKYSDTPIVASISEDLTDIYQDLKNFITIYERGVVEHMNDALCICHENFCLYWGQKLVNVLRALHVLKYSPEIDTEDDGDTLQNDNGLW
ncbi:hypothetical protein M2132_001191 [Dysgonomonas sp. PH5-45]|uniref:DUF5063 domain-containing protein n=1 Tax=unclassified Dysgonomonas TaxID=2630389 RepID=UPI002475A828|nr:MULTISPECIES: DUF5063 domain-containing protein [unclassified Dysgonomonas]MDH6354858.1 hypothetical protein [Dysgonomonas sp. PH5-45]MDH6387757.1 hypothetical protein [Dysgonomonas sp. PH5-37]